MTSVAEHSMVGFDALSYVRCSTIQSGKEFDFRKMWCNQDAPQLLIEFPQAAELLMLGRIGGQPGCGCYPVVG